MTAIGIAQTCAKRLGITSPSAIVGSTDGNIILLQAMIERTAQELRNEYAWPELQQEYSFTLSSGVASYALPYDFDYFMSESLWNRTQNWPLLGPIDAVAWQQYKSGLITSLPLQRFRVKYWGTNQFFIDPTPGVSENGQTCVYEYISRNVIRPKTWVASTVWTGNSNCSYNGYIFTRNSTGAATTGTSAPTPSSLNDGSITWALYTTPYDTILGDNEEVILDNQMIADGACWRWKAERGFDFENLKAMADVQKDSHKTDLTSYGVLTVGGPRRRSPMIGVWNYPDGDY